MERNNCSSNKVKYRLGKPWRTALGLRLKRVHSNNNNNMTKDGRAEIQCAIALNHRRTSKNQVQRTDKCTHLVPETVVFENRSTTEKNVGKTLNPTQARVRTIAVWVTTCRTAVTGGNLLVYGLL